MGTLNVIGAVVYFAWIIGSTLFLVVIAARVRWAGGGGWTVCHMVGTIIVGLLTQTWVNALVIENFAPEVSVDNWLSRAASAAMGAPYHLQTLADRLTDHLASFFTLSDLPGIILLCAAVVVALLGLLRGINGTWLWEAVLANSEQGAGLNRYETRAKVAQARLLERSEPDMRRFRVTMCRSARRKAFGQWVWGRIKDVIMAGAAGGVYVGIAYLLNWSTSGWLQTAIVLVVVVLVGIVVYASQEKGQEDDSEAYEKVFDRAFDL